MIPLDFAYYRPDSIAEAVELWSQLAAAGKQPLYYSGGSELVTLARINQLVTQAVIDLKGIPECRRLEQQADQLLIGSAVNITQLVESNCFPLLSASAGRIADHTSRGSITLGGNLCGSFYYREAALALLVAESQVVIAGQQGLRTEPLLQVFDQRMQLLPGEFLVQVQTDRRMTELPYRAAKKTRQDYVGYPLVSVAMLRDGGRLRLAVSGLLAYPFRSAAVEQALNAIDLSSEQRIEQATAALPGPILGDAESSAGYRQFVWRGLLSEALTWLGEE